MQRKWFSPLKKFHCFFFLTRVVLFLILGSFIGCQSSTTKVDKNTVKDVIDTTNIEVPKTMESSSKSISLTISSKKAIVRAEADPKAVELVRYNEGSTLEYLGELSTFTTIMNIQGLAYNEPWLKVKTVDGRIGWIYGGCIRFNGLSDQKLAEMVFDKRLKNIFGAALATQIKIYQNEIADMQTAEAFRMLYKRGGDLRDQIEKQLNEKLALATVDSLPDFFWLNECLTGFLVHLIDSASNYKLYRDFSSWDKLSKATKTQEDDLLLAPFLIAYHSDSIEYTDPDWRLALSKDETYSLLGRGIHKNTLDALQIALKEGKLFDEELHQLKHKLLDDISLSKNFWEDQQSILNELQAIIQSNYHFLNEEDKVELNARYKMLQSPDEYDISTNLFEGEDS